MRGRTSYGHPGTARRRKRTSVPSGFRKRHCAPDCERPQGAPVTERGDVRNVFSMDREEGGACAQQRAGRVVEANVEEAGDISLWWLGHRSEAADRVAEGLSGGQDFLPPTSAGRLARITGI